MYITVEVISEPRNVTGCASRTAMFTCVMKFQNVNISTVDVKWWRRRNDGIFHDPLPINTQGTNVFSITSSVSGGMLTSTLMITSLKSAHVGPYWFGMANGTRLSAVAFLSIVPSGMCIHI